MMRKIQNIHDLRLEQGNLELRRLQLEKELQYDWNDLKHIISNAGNSFFIDVKGNYVSRFVSKAISIGVHALALKFGGKIGSKIFSWFK